MMFNFLKKKQYKYEGKREYDIEGKCYGCHKRLNLYLERTSNHEVRLKIEPCKIHPEKSIILWPHRDDIISKGSCNN